MKNKFIALVASLMLVSFPQLTLSAEPSESEDDTKGKEEEKGGNEVWEPKRRRFL